ncbi:hypothetical protein ACFQZZ_28770 [Nocardia sp. GCM10030253]|uniref:hypothetical protein n=1 Tax=Nocardia sp. GCM10030253 TaxID=3273404 RepID=UPI00362B31E5
MTGLDILIIGRSRRTVDTATEQLRSLGFTARGVIADDEAVTMLDAREVTTLSAIEDVDKPLRGIPAAIGRLLVDPPQGWEFTTAGGLFQAPRFVVCADGSGNGVGGVCTIPD